MKIENELLKINKIRENIFKYMLIGIVLLCLISLIANPLIEIDLLFLIISCILIFLCSIAALIVYQKKNFEAGVVVIAFYLLILFIPILWIRLDGYNGVIPVLIILFQIMFIILLSGQMKKIITFFSLFVLMLLFAYDFYFMLQSTEDNLNTFLFSFIFYFVISIAVIQILSKIMNEYNFLNDNLFKQSITDTLTQAYNYEYGYKILNKIVKRANIDNTYVSVLIINIDNFKAFNAEHGHKHGNVALKEMADDIRNELRPVDILCRYGGDEFLVIIPNMFVKKAIDVGTRINHCIKNEELKVSIGVVDNEEIYDVNELIGKAEKAMYLAKIQGKNKVVQFRNS